MEIPDLNLSNSIEIGAGLGAANWGAMEVLGTNYVTELLGSGGEAPVYLAVGAAGVVLLADKLEAVDVMD